VKIGVLTGGGDCPGLNPAIRGIVFRATQKGHEVVGFLDGWKGVRDDRSMPLRRVDVVDQIGRGGTMLGSSRTHPFRKEEDAAKVLATIQRHGLDALIAIGGDDTLTAALELHKRGGKVVGVPKTMDNDVGGTDWTFGFDSASTVAVDALQRLRDTAASHHRVVILEVMGRNAGWVAMATGLAGGADVTLVPEEPYDEPSVLARVASAVKLRGCAVIVVSEGIDLGKESGDAAAQDEFGHELLRERGVGATLAKRIEEKLTFETRSAQIGHIQRGGPPTLFDRILATRLGVEAADLALAGKFGQVAVLQGHAVRGVPLEECLKAPKLVSPPWLDLLHTFDP
jgi:phosphofructokinase-like protein